MDNFQPLLLNNANDGGDWRAHRVSRSQVWGRQAKTELGSAEIWEYTRGLIEENIRKETLKRTNPFENRRAVLYRHCPVCFMSDSFPKA